MQFTFASNNVHKLNEIRTCFPPGCSVLSLKDCGITESLPETGVNLRQNALQKAAFVYKKTTGFSFADDSGLEIEALGGRPGVYSARYSGEGCTDAMNISKVLKEMENITHRKAVFRTVIAVIINEVTLFFEGVIEGVITHSSIGVNGFGYDPIFIPNGFNKTFAQMTFEEKNRISHRNLACRELYKFLLAYPAA
ncbi:MAG: RdgB/HAM1 family non-canonical purine NTP pyrophosphatase [Bacteroidia bacterium]|nr:RdgB/HAM1 family non-canonical purine NTP pyrophosphatase [Bacteroidia bacterium]MCZ2276432.1 RdgB/HAM1 family non-canonical purine NTP pyrophosphatase [Bacteroidia bacterium]